MKERCVKCLANSGPECNDIPDEYVVYTDVTASEDRFDEKRGVRRIKGAHAQHARCMMRRLGAARIIAMAEQLKKLR